MDPSASADLVVTVAVPLLVGITASLIASFIGWRYLERRTKVPVKRRRQIVIAIAAACIVTAVAFIPHQVPAVSITSPGNGGTVSLQGTDPAIFTATGTSRYIAGTNREILLWVRPLRQGSGAAWFLQCPPYGVRMDSDGSWTALGVLGNSRYPPEPGDRFSVMATVMDRSTAEGMFAGQCPYSNLYPVGDFRTSVDDLAAGTIG